MDLNIRLVIIPCAHELENVIQREGADNVTAFHNTRVDNVSMFLTLPVITIGAGAAARLSGMTRANMLEVLRSDYILTARAKGVGVPPEVPSWGNILAQGRCFIRSAPWITLYSGIIISAAVLSVNQFGDGLRDIPDPKLRR